MAVADFVVLADLGDLDFARFGDFDDERLDADVVVDVDAVEDDIGFDDDNDVDDVVNLIGFDDGLVSFACDVDLSIDSADDINFLFLFAVFLSEPRSGYVPSNATPLDMVDDDDDVVVVNEFEKLDEDLLAKLLGALSVLGENGDLSYSKYTGCSLILTVELHRSFLVSGL